MIYQDPRDILCGTSIWFRTTIWFPNTRLINPKVWHITSAKHNALQTTSNSNPLFPVGLHFHIWRFKIKTKMQEWQYNTYFVVIMFESIYINGTTRMITATSHEYVAPWIACKSTVCSTTYLGRTIATKTSKPPISGLLGGESTGNWGIPNKQRTSNAANVSMS